LMWTTRSFSSGRSFGLIGAGMIPIPLSPFPSSRERAG
jgi:hypothetical protein